MATPKPEPPRHMTTQECVVYAFAVVAATVIACVHVQYALWCLGLIAVVSGVKIADLLALKAGKGGTGPVGPAIAVLAGVAFTVAGCLQ